jgi:hypothetical protein
MHPRVAIGPGADFVSPFPVSTPQERIRAEGRESSGESLPCHFRAERGRDRKASRKRSILTRPREFDRASRLVGTSRVPLTITSQGRSAYRLPLGHAPRCQPEGGGTAAWSSKTPLEAA